MGLVTFLDPVDYINGKISKKSRTIYNRRKQSDRRYTQVRNPRLTSVTSDERAARLRFGNIGKAVAARRKNLSTVAADLTAFNAQKDTANGYKTFFRYLWHVCANEYDQTNG